MDASGVEEGVAEMSVYVDGSAIFGGDNAPRCFRNKPSCHMYADTLDELHAMAARIGMRRAWFQDHRMLKHYDLVPSKRALAIQYGAMEQDRRTAVETWRRLRAEK